MGRQTWKKLIQDSDTVSYVKNLGDYRIIIEARNTDAEWEIIKKYVGGGINFAETYTAKTTGELKTLLKHLRSEKDLSKTEINDINSFRNKDVRVQVKRAYKTETVEKWNFCITDNYSNYITVHYTNQELIIDIVMEQRLKYIEENIIEKLYDVLAIDKEEYAIQQNIYYFSKKSSTHSETQEEEVDVEFIFE